MALALSPVVRALVDPDGALRDIRNLDSVSRDVSDSFPIDFLCASELMRLIIGKKFVVRYPGVNFFQQGCLVYS